jgi:hypothetical protein
VKAFCQTLRGVTAKVDGQTADPGYIHDFDQRPLDIRRCAQRQPNAIFQRRL